MLGGWAAGRLGGNDLTDRKRVLGGILFLFALVMLTGSFAMAQEDAAMETIKVNVEKVLGVLRDPALQGEAAEPQKKEAIRKISNEMFHWDLVSKRVLSKNWKSFSDGQQQEFVSLFKEILEQAYADRILAYKDETIKYVSCQMLSENKAEVETHIISDGTLINLTYRLGLLDGKWGVYDVIVEGVSLTSNYRTQFRDYLADKKPAELLDHLKKKVEG
jgi:phospholipid transport system substrate-binding protein